MKILLDECLPVRLKNYFSDFEVATVAEMGWTGLKNGKLLNLAVGQGFDIFFTVDKNLQFQQKISEFDIAIVVFDLVMNRLQDILPLLPKTVEMLTEMKKKKVYVIG